MKPSLKNHLIRLVGAFRLDEQGTLFCDQTALPKDASLASQDRNRALHGAISNAIYLSAHCQRFGEHRFDVINDTGQDITSLLSQSNANQSRWDLGWRLEKPLANGAWSAVRGRETAKLAPGEFVLDDPYGPGIAPGCNVRVLRSHESTSLQPGIYFAFGTAKPATLHPGERLIRFYWNVRVEGATALVKHITREFQRFQVPFRFKIMSQTQLFYRIDTAVLYISADYFRIAASLVGRIQSPLSGFLRPQHCLFTKPIAPGISLAEDPGHHQSFGQVRCALLADAVMDCLYHGYTTQEDIWRTIKLQFDTAGLTLDAPFLNPGSLDSYSIDYFNLEEAA